jgi:hypothetical protein
LLWIWLAGLYLKPIGVGAAGKILLQAIHYIGHKGRGRRVGARAATCRIELIADRSAEHRAAGHPAKPVMALTYAAPDVLPYRAERTRLPLSWLK